MTMGERVRRFVLDLPRLVMSPPLLLVERVRVARRRQLSHSESLGGPTPIEAAMGLSHGPIRVEVACEYADDERELVRLLHPALEPLAAADAEGYGSRFSSTRHGTNSDSRQQKVTVRRPDGPLGAVHADIDGQPIPGETIPIMTRSLLSILDGHVLTAESHWTHLHAGVVEIDGRGVVIPAVSGAGKSNLVAALAAGQTLLTDELVAVDRAAGLLRAAPRPVCLKPASHDRAARLAPDETRPAAEDPWLVPAAALGARIAAHTGPDLLVLPSRRDGKVDYKIVGPSEALEALIAESFDVTVDPARSLEDLAWLAASTLSVRLGYGEARDAVPMIEELARRADGMSTPEEWFVVEAPSAQGDHPRRGAAVLSVVIGDGAVLWRPDTKQVLRLDGAGAAVWEFLDGGAAIPTQLDDFVAELRTEGMIDDPNGSVNDRPDSDADAESGSVR